MLRTHTCGQLNEKDIGGEVTLCGWVLSRRDHGDIIFLDLRDAYGITQTVFDKESNAQVHAVAEKVRSEFVIQAKGTVRKRPDDTENPKLPTGKIEVLITQVTILNDSLTPPFEVKDDIPVGEEARLKYRYVDLRRPLMQNNLRTRYRVTKIMRDYLDKEGFIDIETPILTKSTPEGARDYLVPSRVNEGQFYALPQSPQIFKQILMVAGFDRYYQIAKCFRDEDLRADRQPEFTQLDVELSFVEQEDIFLLFEGLLKKLFKEIINYDLPDRFERMPYSEAMSRFGSDKPDRRFAMELIDLSDMLKDCEFKVFSQTLASGGKIKAITAKGCADYSRSKIDELTALAQSWGAKGLAYFVIREDKIQSPIQKFFKQDELESILSKTSASAGDIVFFCADSLAVCDTVLGNLRLKIAKDRGLIDKTKFDVLWVTDFPLFKYNEEEKRWDSEHHPFTSFCDEDMTKFESGDYGNIRSRSYDLVINGVELASGSIRIHSPKVQSKIFDILGIQNEEAAKRFGFLLEAFKYGAPPHGGIAIGLDRLLTLFLGCDSIRDVMAFPKTQRAQCPMTDAPSCIDKKQLDELNIRLTVDSPDI
ncbi:MAG: aspartate--tRNA ligase [Candidatus Omnitrophica bacterium]|nr:aspartate--tRNA ligase [Candidatus Omnitrophota bacterium]